MGDYALTYDAENRLTQVDKTVSGVTTTVALFTFDGDGKRVKSVAGSETTLFVGSQYEVTNGNATKYYFAGSQRIALRSCTGGTCSAPTYLAGDHLGSTSLVTDASGALITKTLYKPWGEVRYNTPNTTLSTRYTYTGQYSYISDDATDLGSNGFGLMYYGARFYDPALSRFSSADTIVPGVGTSQAWDRYAYGMNNPLRYIDPSGHSPCGSSYSDPDCEEEDDNSNGGSTTTTTTTTTDPEEDDKEDEYYRNIAISRLEEVGYFAGGGVLPEDLLQLLLKIKWIWTSGPDWLFRAEDGMRILTGDHPHSGVPFYHFNSDLNNLPHVMNAEPLINAIANVRTAVSGTIGFIINFIETTEIFIPAIFIIPPSYMPGAKIYS
jgi:RHS repeat-associated protein